MESHRAKREEAGGFLTHLQPWVPPSLEPALHLAQTWAPANALPWASISQRSCSLLLHLPSEKRGWAPVSRSAGIADASNIPVSCAGQRVSRCMRAQLFRHPGVMGSCLEKYAAGCSVGSCPGASAWVCHLLPPPTKPNRNHLSLH